MTFGSVSADPAVLTLPGGRQWVPSSRKGLGREGTDGGWVGSQGVRSSLPALVMPEGTVSMAIRGRAPGSAGGGNKVEGGGKT